MLVAQGWAELVRNPPNVAYVHAKFPMQGVTVDFSGAAVGSGAGNRHCATWTNEDREVPPLVFEFF